MFTLTGIWFAIWVASLQILGVSSTCLCSNGGTTKISSPCVCDCIDDYALPTCEWKNVDYVSFIFVFDNVTEPTHRFAASLKADRVAKHYDVPLEPDADGRRPVEVLRRRTDTEPPGDLELHYVFNVRGNLSYPVMLDGQAGPAQWMKALGILQAYRSVPSDADASPLADGGATVFSYTILEREVPVSLAAVAWTFGAAGVLIVLPVLEAIFSALCYNAEGAPDEDLTKHHGDTVELE
jgi:hypothetical protein